MVFVDGENFTIRGQKVANDNSIALEEGKYYHKDTFLWFPRYDAHNNLYGGYLRCAPKPIRSIYYTSALGDDKSINKIENSLWELNFQPSVFKKTRQEKTAKGVDIALTKDILINAFLNNYDIAVLVAGDGDYIPVIEEIKRLGKVVYLAFFANYGLNEKLKLACDSFIDLSGYFIPQWKEYSSK